MKAILEYSMLFKHVPEYYGCSTCIAMISFDKGIP